MERLRVQKGVSMIKKVELANDVETTIKLLNENGFRDNELNKENPVYAYEPIYDEEKNWFCAIKTNDKEKIAIVLENTDICVLHIYHYKGQFNNHEETKKEIEAEPYYQELIEQGILKNEQSYKSMFHIITDTQRSY